MGKEFRMVEALGDHYQLAKKLKINLVPLNFDYVTAPFYYREKTSSLLNLTLNKGPEVTIRPLSDRINMEMFSFEHWKPALGDLELF
jgi:hypothetical protein